MAELLPDRMGTSPKSSYGDSESAKQKFKRRPISSIIEWVQCFNVYLSVVCRTCPGRIPDLLAYQMLIIEASMVYEGNAWLGYDRRFRQAAAATPHMQWSKTDTDFVALGFYRHGKADQMCALLKPYTQIISVQLKDYTCLR